MQSEFNMKIDANEFFGPTYIMSAVADFLYKGQVEYNWIEVVPLNEKIKSDTVADSSEVSIIQREQINLLSDALRRFINLRIGATITHEELKIGFDSAVLEAIKVLTKIGEAKRIHGTV